MIHGQHRSDGDAESATAQIGIFSRSDFKRAQDCMPELTQYASYDEWLDMREGYMVGLSSAGLATNLVPISFDIFTAWCTRRRRLPTERQLDELASRHVALTQRVNSGELHAIPLISRADFVIWHSRIYAISHFDRYEDYCAAEAARIDCSDDEHDRFVPVEVSLAAFSDWALCLALTTSRSNLDDYALLVAELDHTGVPANAD